MVLLRDLSLMRALLLLLIFGGPNLVLATKESTANSIQIVSLADILKKEGGSQNIVGAPDTATALAQKLAGPGLTIKTAQFITGRTSQFGTFSGGSDSIGMEEGILLSTGDVANVRGPNVSPSTTSQYNGPGYAPLDAFVSAGVALLDAAVLEITFQCANAALNNALTLNYVFGSEEYPEYVFESYSDVFAFFLDGNQKSNNIALLQDGAAVSIDTINCGKNNDGINAKNCDLYVDNNYGQNAKYNTELDGFTKPLQIIKSQELSPGDHVIAIAIADAGDPQFDSVVFLQSGSLDCVTHGLTKAPTPMPTEAPTTVVSVTLRVFVQYDENPSEFSWKIRDEASKTNVVKYQRGKITEPNAYVKLSLQLTPGNKYKLIAKDLSGDGLGANGYIKIYKRMSDSSGKWTKVVTVKGSYKNYAFDFWA